MEMVSTDEDTLLRFMDNCPAYIDSPITMNSKSEATKLQKSQHFEKLVLEPLSEHVGFSLTIEDAEGLYDLCVFEHVSPTETNNSSFCDMIPRSAYALMDYERDLSRYYESSYPNKLGYELSCVLLQDLLKQLDSEEQTTALRFAHSETIVPLISLLGINKDTDTVYTWDKKQFWNRTTKMSEIDPFATNLGFVLFRNISSDEDLIKIFMNEREVKIPVCVSDEGCTKSEILKIIQNTEGGCDRSAMCFGTNSSNNNIINPTEISSGDSGGNVTSLLSNSRISQEYVDAAIAAKLASENKVLLDYYLFILETGLSGLCIVLIGFIAMNCKKIISDSDSHSGYQKMPFLDS
jgi:multiple inositol-polyphosphate phosphatase/2,3-bisphosphoglycerate 3-phosphatase